MNETQVISIKKPWWRRNWVIATGIAFVVIIFLSSILGSNSSALNQARATIATQKSTISSMQGMISNMAGQLKTAQDQAATAEASARNAKAIADAAAAKSYASRNAQLDQRAANLKSQQGTIASAEGTLEKNNISADGNYVITRDIKSGTWHTAGDGGSGSQCYYEVDRTGNYSDISNIAENANFDGPETVNLSGFYSFQISGPCTWYLTS